MNKTQFLSMALPHDIKFDIQSDIYKYPVMQGLRKDYIEFNYHGTYLSFHKDFIGKPVLRPLSDLKLDEGVGFDVVQKVIRMKDNGDWLYLLANKIKIDELPFYLIELLVSFHFDICGLIEKGEAVDYHTLSDFVF